MPSGARRGSFLVWLLVLAWPLLGLAQKGSARYEEVQGRAKEAFDGGKFQDAADLFKEAFDLEPRGNLLYNIALSYEKAGSVAEAVVYYQRFIDAVPGTPKRASIERHLAELKTQLQDKYVDVNVSTNPPGAVIFVDDKGRGAMGASPITFKLLPGSYVIIAEKQGYETTRKKVELGEGREMLVDLTLYDSSTVGSVAFMISERDADVMVDGRRIGKSPFEEQLRLPAGPHEVMVMKSGFKTWKKKVEVKAGDTAKLEVALATESGEEDGGAEDESESGPGLFSGPRLWPTVVMGVGVLLVGGGVYTGLQASNLHDQLDAKRKKDEKIAPSDVDTGNSLVLTTNVLFGAGAAALIGGGVWFFLAGDGGNEASSSVDVGWMPEGTPAVMYRGSF